jgi:hypothetical protein
MRELLDIKFGASTLDPTYEVQLSEATPRAFNRYLRRVLTADSLAAVFATAHTRRPRMR